METPLQQAAKAALKAESFTRLRLKSSSSRRKNKAIQPLTIHLPLAPTWLTALTGKLARSSLARNLLLDFRQLLDQFVQPRMVALLAIRQQADLDLSMVAFLDQSFERRIMRRHRSMHGVPLYSARLPSPRYQAIPGIVITWSKLEKPRMISWIKSGQDKGLE
jgi:hypothetical protein